MPWGRLDDSLYDHPKLDRLPLEHRNACVGLWARAISWCNRFLTDGQVPRDRVVRLDGTTAEADMNVAAGLFDETATGYAVHDFLQFNDSRAQVNDRREKEAKRKADWRAKHSPGGTPGGTATGDDPNVPPGVPPSVPPGHGSSGANVPGGVPPSVPASVPGFPARASRSANPDPTRPDPNPTRPNESLPRESRASGRSPKADVAALLALGWAKVSRPQRATLAEIADRHRRDGNDGTWFAVSAIEAAGDTDPFRAVIDADRLWQESQRRRADAEEANGRAAKETEQQQATTAAAANPDWIGAVKSMPSSKRREPGAEPETPDWAKS